MNTNPHIPGLNFEKVWLMFQETDKKFQETKQELEERFKETDRLQKETDRQQKETALQMKETDRKLKELGISHGGLSNNIGESVEEFFFHGLEKKPVIGKIRFKKIVQNMKTDDAEYDIVLTNGIYVAVIEVKHKFHPDSLEKFVTKKIPVFKKEFPKFATCKIIACIAGFVIPKATRDKANTAGLYIFTQSGERIKTLNDKNFKPKEY